MTTIQLVLYVVFSAVVVVLVTMFVTDFMANKCEKCGSRITFGNVADTVRQSRTIHNDYVVYCLRCGHSRSTFQGPTETGRQE